MEDDFDSQFADELEAMEDFDEPDSLSPKPRRSLQFNTPGRQLPAEPGNEASFIPIQSPLTSGKGSLRKGIITSQLGSSQKKRAREVQHGDNSDSDLEYDDEDLNSTAPVSKRSKIDDQLDEDDLWGDDVVDKPAKVEVKHLYGNQSKKVIEVEEQIEAPPSPDRLVMARILEHRNKQQIRELKLDKDLERTNRLVDDYDFERQRVFTRMPSTAYVPATGTGGSRVYMTVKDDLVYDKEFESMGKTLTGSNLLNVPIADLREQLEEERRSLLLAESQRLSDEVNRQLEEDQGFMEDDDDEDKENQVPLPDITQEVQKLLWVEKYAPRQYTDLLSEESINRSLLHWLKMWDYVVFDKEIVVKKNKEKKKEKPDKYKKKNQPAVLDELDKHRRPLQTVSLLCGPPGLGKTTLAHIIARHAGYNVVEMNASDDRSAEVFKTRIEAATQMKAVLGADPRPNCLIIDEIDGAPQAAINVLLNLVKKTDVPEPTKKKKKDEGGILRRPIICICNDQYVPALRQLRQNAMVLNFPQTDPTKLAGRLYEVSRLERMKSDMNILLSLCEKTDNDIRSCLNTLQFIQRQSKEVTLKNVHSMAVGQKDSHKSLFSVWSDVLTLPKPKRQKFVNAQEISADQMLNTAPKARFTNIVSVVQGAGEYDKLNQGLFENYLDCKFKDPYMDGVSMATEWLCYSDLVNEYIQHMQDYRLMPYLPYTSVIFHFLFASNIMQKLKYPHSQAECNQKKIKCENLVSCMMADMSPRIRKYINVPVVVMEILPPLMDIIQPMFRPINTQLYSTKEKEDLAHLVRVMISYNMTYQQEKSLEGQYLYVLEPHMDEVGKFPGMKQHRQLSYASKQLVAREVELEKMRRIERARGPPIEQQTRAAGGGGDSSTSKKDEKMAATPSHLQRLTAKPLGNKEEESQIKDFFGRVIKRTTPEAKKGNSDSSGEPVKANVLATDIWFHFQGGYSNAVRRSVKIKDFF